MAQAHRGFCMVGITTIAMVMGGCKSDPAPQATPPGTGTAPAQAVAPAAKPVPAVASPSVHNPVATPVAATSTTQSATIIKSAPASIDAILAGSKTSTTRKGIRSYALGPAVTTDGRRRVSIEITTVEPKRVSNLTAADATSDGSTSLAAYRAALLRSYPGLTDDDIVSVVHFHVVGPH